MRALFRRLRRDERGNTIIEFAIVAPVMALTMMGLGDLLHQSYAQSVLDGAVQKAGRDSAIQGGAEKTTQLDDKVMTMVRRVANDATYTSTRRNETTFTRVGPEAFTDAAPYNGVRDPGECFDDVNKNGVWDSNPGKTGQGGASDVTIYRVEVTYRRPFPVWSFLGKPSTQTIAAQTILKNQPYASQAAASTPPRVCT